MCVCVGGGGGGGEEKEGKRVGRKVYRGGDMGEGTWRREG